MTRRENAAKEVRDELKRRGITPRQVSVRTDSNGINIRIKDFSVCAEMVEEIAKKHEKIDYCQVTQEILCGGNFFVSVVYDWQVESEIKKTPEFLAIKDRVLEKLKRIEGSTGVEIVDGFTAFKSQNGWSYQTTIEWDKTSYWHHYADAVDITMRLYKDVLQGKIDKLTI